MAAELLRAAGPIARLVDEKAYAIKALHACLRSAASKRSSPRLQERNLIERMFGRLKGSGESQPATTSLRSRLNQRWTTLDGSPSREPWAHISG
jgi:hypothetical protein